MKDRPWIWVIVAHIAIIAVLATVVVISQKYRQPEVPVVVHGR
jgi:anti-sigma-K factor RskA